MPTEALILKQVRPDAPPRYQCRANDRYTSSV